MEAKEIQDILTVLKVNYPQSFKGWTKQQGQLYMALWQKAFKDTESWKVKAAVYHYIFETDREFAPNVGMINRYINSDVPEYMLAETAMKLLPDSQEVKKLKEKFEND